MSFSYRIAGVLVLTLAALVAAFGGNSRQADAAGASIECQIPLNIVCEISHPDGVAHVKVTLLTGIGEVAAVDKSFRCEKTVYVSWDPIVPNGTIEVKPCSGMKLAPNGRGGSDSTLGLVLQGTDSRWQPAVLIVVALDKPDLGDFKAEEVVLHDFYCGGKNLVPCDDTFKDFCVKVAGGTYRELEGGSGACITPGGWNPDPF